MLQLQDITCRVAGRTLIENASVAIPPGGRIGFVGRNPGMTVAQLLEILRITKQSLSRVLKDLLEKSYVFQKEGPEDRRQRLLFLTSEGEALWQKLINPQMQRFRDAALHLGEGDGALYRELFLQLVNAENRDTAESWVARASGGQRSFGLQRSCALFGRTERSDCDFA